MQIGDCEPYNFEHLYQTISNGDVLEAVPVPVYDGAGGKEQNVVWTDSCASLAASCDERAAAVDMLCYILKCGLKYVSDYSLGAVSCEYEGLQGTSQLSVNYLNAFQKVLNRRAREIKKIENYDAEYVTTMNEYLDGFIPFVGGTRTGVKALVSYAEITQMPPESSIPAIKQAYLNSLNTYNTLYIRKAS